MWTLLVESQMSPYVRFPGLASRQLRRSTGVKGCSRLAAGEFLTDPDQFRRIQAVAPKDWQQKNFELVLSADVIRGKSGHPNIVASHFW